MISASLPVKASGLLKQETKKLHAATEGVMLQQIRDIQSVADYGQLLSMLHGYFAPLEAAVMAVLSNAVLPDLQKRKRSSLLQKDAAAIGVEISLQQAGSLPVMRSIEETFGVLYVLEGSSLGGVHIAAMIEKKLPEVAHALLFFKGYGEQTPAMWQSFRQALDSRLQTEEQKAAALFAANQTFDFMKQWMEGQGK